MGAIAVHLSRSAPPEPETVRRMLGAAPHRGDALETARLGGTVLGICNDAGWTNATLARADGRMAAFCGALDNDEALREELRREGARPPADPTPAATLLAAHDRWGADAVRRLRGSFAAVLTDGREALCFRDQFGARPLFRHDGPEGFFAATEVKQVLAGAPIPREPDLDHLHGVLFGGVDRSTAYRGVERVPKATLVTAGPEPGPATRPYWDPAGLVESSRLGPDEAAEGVVVALERAVRRVLTGRDAVLLSGGLDSPALAAFAADAPGPDGARGSGTVQALTAVYPDHPSADESEWTRTAARHLGLPLHEYVADAGSLDAVDRWVRVLDGPVDVVSIPESAEAYAEARALGARTVINGEIAEMLFESRGYLLDHLLSHGRLRAAGRVISGMREAGTSRRKILRRVLRALAPPALVAALRDGDPGWQSALPPWVDVRPMLEASSAPPMRRLSPRRRWIEMQTAAFQGPGIGFEADEICAATCGVDSRRPFADVDLWEFVLGLPAEVKFPGRRTKPLLRRAMRGLLPDELIDRKDKTFFDEFHLARADYPTLERLLVGPDHRLDGIDYDVLRARLDARDMSVYELQWARNVAKVHAFLEQW